MEHKATEPAPFISEVFKRQQQTYSLTLLKKLRGGDGSLEDRVGFVRSYIIDNDQLKAILEAYPRKTTGEVAEELDVDHTTFVRHLYQTSMFKRFNNRALHEMMFAITNFILRFFCNKNHLFLIAVYHVTKWILYNN